MLLSSLTNTAAPRTIEDYQLVWSSKIITNNNKNNRRQKQNLKNWFSGDFRHVVTELGRISRESEDIQRQGVPLNFTVYMNSGYNTRLKGQSV